MGPALAATLKQGEFAPTLNLNVSYHRPGSIGTFLGKGRIVKRGRDVCFLAAELYQDGELVASATATAIVRALPKLTSAETRQTRKTGAMGIPLTSWISG